MYFQVKIFFFKGFYIKLSQKTYTIMHIYVRKSLKSALNQFSFSNYNFLTEDHGQWTCLLTDSEHLGTDKSTILIEVAVPAKVHFDPSYEESGVLRITEGETTKVR